MIDIDWAKVNQQVEAGYISAQRHPSAPLTIYNYTHKTQYDWAWTPETMACRGIIRRDDGEIIARPFPKFFSVEQLNGNLPDGPFDVYEKMDGSLGVLYAIDGMPYIATRGSFISEQAQWGTDWLHNNFPGLRVENGWTFLFEIIYRQNRIVVDYGDFQGLVLLAVIDNETGRDVEPPDIGIPVVRRFDGIKDIAALSALEEENKEGFVLHFTDSNQRVKVKFAEYKRLHKILTGLTARHIWEALQTPNGLDPILERVPDEFYSWVQTVAGQLRDGYAAVESQCQREFAAKPEGDRKTIAEKFKACEYSAVLFKMLDGRDYSDLIWKRLYPEASRAFKEDDGE